MIHILFLIQHKEHVRFWNWNSAKAEFRLCLKQVRTETTQSHGDRRRHTFPSFLYHTKIHKVHEWTNYPSLCGLELPPNRTGTDCNGQLGLQKRSSVSACPDLYFTGVQKWAGNISADPSHSGHDLFHLLPSGRRYRAVYAKTSRNNSSFFPTDRHRDEHIKHCYPTSLMHLTYTYL